MNFLANPDNALTLYILLVLVGFMFGARWASVRDAIVAAGTAGQVKAAAG